MSDADYWSYIKRIKFGRYRNDREIFTRGR